MSRVHESPDPQWQYLTVFLIVLAFVPGVWSGLFAGFDGDDLMNLHEAAEKNTLQQILLGLVFPFTPINRPTGELYYRVCYWLFGWNPLGFRLVTCVFMAANVVMVYALARRIFASVETGLLSALLFAFHGRLWQVYRSNGTVYDVLCAFFSLLALWLYVDGRTGEHRFSAQRWVLLAVVFVAALNAKEMAAVLPALFLIYDWTCAAPERSLAKRVRWIWGNSWPAVLLGVLTAAAFWGKTRAGGPFLNPAYAMSFTVGEYFRNARWLYSELFYLRPHTLVGRHVVLLFILLFAIAAVSRKRPLWFSAWCAVLMPLPVLFIPPRGFFVMYLPLAGCAMFMAGTLVSARDRFVNPTINRFAGRLLPLGLCLSAVLFGLTDSEFRTHAWTPDPMSRTIDLSKQDWMTLNEPLPPGATILLMGSRFPAEANEWFPYMIAQVLYRDRGLGLYRADRINPSPTPAEFSQYDRVVVFDGSRLKIEMRTPIASGSPRLPSTAPAWR